MAARSTPTDDAVLLTLQLRFNRNTGKVARMHFTGLKDKIKRRKAQTPALPTDNSDSPPNEESPKRRKSSRVAHLRKKLAVNEKMRPSAEANGDRNPDSILREQFKAAQESPDYASGRADLLATEHANAWDSPARSRASQAEIDANTILLKFRENERIDKKLYGNIPSEAVPGEDTRDMGGRFLVNKDRIERSNVFDMASKMPKGAHLHVHFNSELPADRLLPHARKPEMEDTMFIRSTKPLLAPKDYRDAEILFEVRPKEPESANIFQPNYNPNLEEPDKGPSWMRWVDFRSQFPQAAKSAIESSTRDPNTRPISVAEFWEPGRMFPEIALQDSVRNSKDLVSVAEYWVQEKMFLTKRHVYDERQTTNGVWACFNQGTRAFKGLLNYESVYRWYIGAVIDSMIQDKVMYAELRPMLLSKFIRSNDGKRKLGLKEQMAIICEEVQKKRKELEKAGRSHLFPFGLKIIYSTPRSIERDKMKSELQDCIDLKLQFPDLICGFDLVGAEDRPFHIGYYADLLVAFANTCKELNISIPFLFHAGESLLDTGGSHNPDNSNLYDALLLNSRRIGHGYSILKHPLLVEKYKKQGICLELCPISNELLHLCGNARQHIFPELLAAGLECTLNADNPSLFRGAGSDSGSLAHEFYQVMIGDTRMTIHGWKQLALWSIEHACLEESQKQEAKEIFYEEWEAYCQWIVSTYGDSAKTLGDLIHETHGAPPKNE